MSMKNIRNLVSISLAAFAVFSAVVAADSAFAQDKMGKMDHKMGGKMGGKMDKKMAGVYVCPICKMGYTPMQAKKMGMKDPMGHKLVKMAMLPEGMTMAPAHGGMMGHKMG